MPKRGDKQRKSGHFKSRDFWRDWHREWHFSSGNPLGKAPVHDAAHLRPPARKARRWREYFRDFMGTWPEQHWAFGSRRFNPWLQGEIEFNPFVASLLSKGGGLLPLLVLNILSIRPQYGNEIMDSISERTTGQWLANPGAVYPLLSAMEENGLVQGKWEDPQKRTVRIYFLTDSGRQELARMKAIIHPRLQDAIQAFESLLHDLERSDSD